MNKQMNAFITMYFNYYSPTLISFSFKVIVWLTISYLFFAAHLLINTKMTNLFEKSYDIISYSTLKQ